MVTLEFGVRASNDSPLKKNRIKEFQIKPQDDEKYIYFAKGLPIVKVEEKKTRIYDEKNVTFEQLRRDPLKIDSTVITEQTVVVRDPFSNECFTTKLGEDGIDCVIFPKFETIIAQRLKSGDKIMLDGKISTIDRIEHIENGDVIMLDGELTTIENVESLDPLKRFLFLYFKESDVAKKINWYKMFDVVMFKHHTIKEQGIPEAGQKIFYQNELKTIESVNSSWLRQVVESVPNSSTKFYIRFTDGGCTDTFSQDSLLLIASHHLTEDDSVIL